MVDIAGWSKIDTRFNFAISSNQFFIIMHHTFLVVTVKKWLKSAYIYGSYREINIGVSPFVQPCTSDINMLCKWVSA